MKILLPVCEMSACTAVTPLQYSDMQTRQVRQGSMRDAYAHIKHSSVESVDCFVKNKF